MKLIKILIPIAILAFSTTGFAQGQGKVKSEVKEMKAKHLDKKEKKPKKVKGAVKGSDVQNVPDRPQPRPRGNVQGKPRTGGVMPAPKGDRAEDQPRVIPGKPKKGLSNGTVKPGLNDGTVKPTLNNGTVKPRPKNGTVKPGLNNGTVKPKPNKGTVKPGNGYGDKNHEHTGVGRGHDKHPKGHDRPDAPKLGKGNTNAGKPTVGKTSIGMAASPAISKATVKGNTSADKATGVISKAEKDVELYRGKVKAAKDKVLAELKKNPNSKELKDKLTRVQQAEAKVKAMENELIQEKKAVQASKRILSAE